MTSSSPKNGRQPIPGTLLTLNTPYAMENVQNSCNISCFSCSIHKAQNALKMFENKVFRIYLFNL